MSPYSNLSAEVWAEVDVAVNANKTFDWASLVVAASSLALLLAGCVEKRSVLLRGRAWWRNNDAQFVGLLVLMNALNAVFQSQLLAADYADVDAPEEYCWGTYAMSFVTYGAIYTSVYVFCLKRAALT